MPMPVLWMDISAQQCFTLVMIMKPFITGGRRWFLDCKLPGGRQFAFFGNLRAITLLMTISCDLMTLLFGLGRALTHP